MEQLRAVQLRHDSRCGDVSTALFGVEEAEKARRFHRSFPEYLPTPLAALRQLAGALGVRGIYVKDESRRFGLNAFKVLGGSYAVGCEAARRLELPPEELTYALLVSAEARRALGSVVFVTATDGNHGRGVAWTANRLGQRAVVYLPAGTVRERAENIRRLGADAVITELNYDDAVRLARKYAAEHGGIVIQDTSWEGYEEIPRRIMQGYTTMGCELLEQLAAAGAERPTHVFLQAGVGAMAGAMAAFLADYYREARPLITIVEPLNADCLYRTALAADGSLHKVGGELRSIMAGLCCGEPCALAWQQLAACADYFTAVPDEVAALGMRILGNPLPGDAAVVSGESGAAGLGLAAAVLRERRLQWLKDMLQLDDSSVILCISTEGATDTENYRRIVWEGAYAWESCMASALWR